MKQWLVVSAFLCIFLLFLMSACGDGDKEKSNLTTSTTSGIFTATPTTSATQPATITHTPSVARIEPVKIGVICPWSGAMATSGAIADQVIKLVEKQVIDQGGILGGREVNFVRYDDRANVAEAQAGCIKLMFQDKVSALTVGGVTGSEQVAVMDFAEENKIFFTSLFEPVTKELKEYKFTVNSTVSNSEYSRVETELAIKLLKSKKVAILVDDQVSMINFTEDCKDILESSGVDIVYEGRIPLDTIDFMPYLTKIMYSKPDVVILNLSSNQGMIVIAKQIMELGGWGGTQVIAYPSADSALKFTGSDGWYIMTAWFPGLSYPGAIKFENDYKAMYGMLPTGNHVYFYNSLWTAIYAIEMAGTDTDLEKIAQVARSGNLQWDTPIGPARFTPDGDSGLRYNIGHAESGKLIPVTLPE